MTGSVFKGAAVYFLVPTRLSFESHCHSQICILNIWSNYLIHCQKEALSHFSNYETLPVCDMPLQTTGRFCRKSQRLRYSPCRTLARYLISHMDNNVIPSLYFTHACFYSVWGQTDLRKQRKWTQNYRGGGRCRKKRKMRVTHRNARTGCCAWSRRPLHSYQRHSGSGKRIPERNWWWRDRHNCVRGYQPQLVRCYCSVALPPCGCSAHAPEPPAVKIQWPQAMVNCMCTEQACEIMNKTAFLKGPDWISFIIYLPSWRSKRVLLASVEREII